MTLRAALLLLAALAFAISPLFSSFDGFDPGLYPVPQEDPPAQPAGWAFAIWGPIYLWLAAHAAFGLWRRREAREWDAPRGALALSLAIGAPWLWVASFSPLAATAMIWGMLAFALMAALRTTTAADRWILMPPVALYAGWLTAASCVSVALALAGWGIAGEVPAAWIALALALSIGAAVQWRLARAPEYGAAVVWALAAIAVRNPGALGAGAWTGAAVMAALALRALAMEVAGRRAAQGGSPA